MVETLRKKADPIPAEIKVLVASAFVIAIGFGLVAPVLPAYARSFDVGVAAASTVVSVFAFFRLLFAPVGGALVSRLGERPVYLTGLLVVAASSLATAFAQSYGQLLVLRGVGGIGSTMFTVSAMALLVRLAPPTIRGRVSSAYASSFLLGGMLGPVLGGGLAGFGLRVPFVVYAVALVVAAAIVGRRLSGSQLRPAADAPPLVPMRVTDALGDAAYRAALASAFAGGWCNFGVRVAVLPQFAVAVYDATWVAGVALALAAAGTAAALQVAGRLADRVGRKPLVLTGLVVTAAGLGLIGLSGDLLVLLVLSALSGLGAGLLSPGQQATVADVIGSGRGGGPVLGAFQMAQDAGAILGPILVGVVADRFGFGAAFGMTAMVSLLAVLPWLLAPETLDRAVASVRAVDADPFGTLEDGSVVHRLVLGSAPGPVLHLLTLGATVHRLEVTGGDGVRRNVALGHATPADYLDSTSYLGGTIGRYANRIAGGRFPLDGREVRVGAHDRGNHLHGGPDGFDRRLWSVLERSPRHAVLALESPDGDQGFPGAVSVKARFTVSADQVSLVLTATTDAPTPVNLTSHAYLNLDGDGAGSIDEHLLQLEADHYTPVDGSGIPLGGHAPVAGTAFDFREPTRIGPAVRSGEEQVVEALGIDHNFVLREGSGLRAAAVLTSPRTRTRLELLTDQPGLQVYTGNLLDGGHRSSEGRLYRQGDGIALEPQLFPDSPHHPEWPSAVLAPGQTYRAELAWRFTGTPPPDRR